MSNINITNNPGMPGGYQGAIDGAGDQQPVGNPTGIDATKAVTDLVSLITQNMTVSQVNGMPGTTRAINVPELDEADAALVEIADLELLIALLKDDMDETQLAAARTRIESQKAKLDQQHKTQLDKIQDAVDKAREQEKAAKAQRAFGWLGAIFAVVAAVVLTVTTGGAAAGFAIAGAVLAVTSLVLSETKADRAIMKAMAESIQNDFGCDKQTAEAWSQGIYAGVQMILSLFCAIGGGAANSGKAFVELSSAVAKGVKLGMSIAGSVISAGSMASGLGSSIVGYQAGVAQAEATETQAELIKLQKLLEENQDDLQQILQLLNDDLSAIVSLTQSELESERQIVDGIGQGHA